MFGRITITALLVAITLVSGRGSMNLANTLARSEFGISRSVAADGRGTVSHAR